MLVYTGTLAAAAVSILNVNVEFVEINVACLIYLLAAILLTLSVICAVQDIKTIKAKIDSAIEHNHLTAHINDDSAYRAIIFSIPGTVIAGVYTVMNGVIATLNFSLWYLSLSAYYALLCAMRSLIIKNTLLETQQKQNEAKKFRIARTCGVLLTVSTIALGVSVTLMVVEGDSSSYPGFAIYAVATYTFYSIIVSITNIIKAKKKEDVYVKTLRWVAHACALVSLLQLQTAMFCEFEKNKGILVTIANASTGFIVCVAVLALGVQMVVKSNAKINECKGRL